MSVLLSLSTHLQAEETALTAGSATEFLMSETLIHHRIAYKQELLN